MFVRYLFKGRGKKGCSPREARAGSWKPGLRLGLIPGNLGLRLAVSASGAVTRGVWGRGRQVQSGIQDSRVDPGREAGLARQGTGDRNQNQSRWN